jgi:hypothetical protein
MPILPDLWSGCRGYKIGSPIDDFIHCIEEISIHIDSDYWNDEVFSYLCTNLHISPAAHLGV